MFWKKRKKVNKILSAKEGAIRLKTAANLIFQDLSRVVSPVELVMLNALISYMDTFILKCFQNGKLKNTIWILARLVEVRVVLSTSTSEDIISLVKMISALENLIYSEKVKNG